MPKKTFECAETAGAVLITQVKENQKSLHDQVATGCGRQDPLDAYEEPWDKMHGRLERRCYEVFDAMPMLEKWQGDRPYVRRVILVTRYREEIGKHPPTVSQHYYVCNRDMSAQEYGRYIRSHWHIENKYHHVKDTAFLEDKCRKQRNPYIFATCIDFALNILRRERIGNIKGSLYKNALDFNLLFENIKQHIL